MRDSSLEMTEQFEMDRGPSGKLRVNAVSIANLIALVALIATAIGTWNGLTSKVDIINVRLDAATQSMTQLKADMSSTLIARESAARDLSSKVETIANRLTAVETILKRVENKVDK